MSQKVVRYLTAHNHVRVRRAVYKFKPTLIHKTLSDSAHATNIVNSWSKQVNRFSTYTRRLVYTCMCIKYVINNVQDVVEISEEVEAIWNRFVYETLCVIHTSDHMKWLMERQNKKLWTGFIESVYTFFHFLPQDLPVNWSRLYFDSLFQWHTDVCRFLASKFMHTEIHHFGDYMSFLTYRLPDEKLVTSNDNLPVIFDWRHIPERCWSVMLSAAVNFFVSAFNYTEVFIDAKVTKKIENFMTQEGNKITKFFVYLRNQIMVRTPLEDGQELRTLLKVVEILSVTCCLGGEKTYEWIMNECWGQQRLYGLQLFWFELFQLSVDEDIDDSIILFTLLSVRHPHVGRDMLSVLLSHTNEQRMARILNSRFVPPKVPCEEDVAKEVNDALACRLPEAVTNAVAKAVFNIISDSGLHADDIEDCIDRWGQGKIIQEIKTYKKRKSNFLECGQSLKPIGSCCICCRDDRSMFICAPCGHTFCVVCGPLSHEKCHLCKEVVYCRVNRVYSNED